MRRFLKGEIMSKALLVAAAVLIVFLAGFAAAAPPAQAPAAKAKPEYHPPLSTTAEILIRQVKFAVKDLSPDQEKKLTGLAEKYDAEIVPLERAREDDHRASLRQALETRTRIDSKAREIISGVQKRKEERVEQKYVDLVGKQVLTPAQRPLWEAYRLHFLCTFHLGLAGATRDQLVEAGELAKKVVKEIKDVKDADPASVSALSAAGSRTGSALFETRLDVLRQRAAKEILTDEQRQKYLQLLGKREEFLAEVDKAEKSGDPYPALAADKKAQQALPF